MNLVVEISDDEINESEEDEAIRLRLLSNEIRQSPIATADLFDEDDEETDGVYC